MRLHGRKFDTDGILQVYACATDPIYGRLAALGLWLRLERTRRSLTESLLVDTAWLPVGTAVVGLTIIWR